MTTRERIISSCFLIIGSLQLLSAQEWQLVWSDEFNRDGRPDAATWKRRYSSSSANISSNQVLFDFRVICDGGMK